MCANKWQPSGGVGKLRHATVRTWTIGRNMDTDWDLDKDRDRDRRRSRDRVTARQRLRRTHANARGQTDKDTYAVHVAGFLFRLVRKPVKKSDLQI